MDMEQMKEDNKTQRKILINAVLDENIPAKAVSQRDGGKGRKLAYLETWYVINRLNQVFGNLNWSAETINLQQVEGPNRPTYIAKVRITVVQEGQAYPVVKEGTGYGSDKSDLNPHEMAVKEAESDALKRAAMKLGLSLGLALYDKTQEFVGGDDEEGTSTKSTKPTAAKAASKPYVKKVAANSTTAKEKDPILEQITDYSIAAKSQGKVTIPALKEHIAVKYGVDAKEQLSPEQAQEFLAYLKGLVETNNSTQ